jgi:hypothetical protein
VQVSEVASIKGEGHLVQARLGLPERLVALQQSSGLQVPDHPLCRVEVLALRVVDDAFTAEPTRITGIASPLRTTGRGARTQPTGSVKPRLLAENLSRVVAGATNGASC